MTSHSRLVLLPCSCFAFRPSPIPPKRGTVQGSCFFHTTGKIVKKKYGALSASNGHDAFQSVNALRSKQNKSSAVAEMGDCLAATDMHRKAGAAVPISVGELGPHLTQCGLRRGLPLYQVAIWPQQTLTENWGLCQLGDL